MIWNIIFQDMFTICNLKTKNKIQEKEQLQNWALFNINGINAQDKFITNAKFRY